MVSFTIPYNSGHWKVNTDNTAGLIPRIRCTISLGLRCTKIKFLLPAVMVL